MPGLTVRDAMSRDVVTVPATERIGVAVDRVLRRGQTLVVVVDDAGALADIISLHLLTTALMTRLVNPHQELADILSPSLTVDADAALPAAAAVMAAGSLDAVGVVDGGTLVGVLTWTDIGRSVLGPETVRAERRLPR